MAENLNAEEAEKLVVYDFNPNSLPDDYLKAIGLVITGGSQTDHIMRDFIGCLLGIDNAETIALGAHMSMPMKDDIIRAIVELNAPSASEVDVLDDILDTIKEAMALRNAIAHNAFAIHPTTKEIYSMREKARGSLQVDFTVIKVDEIFAVADSVYQAGMALQEFMISRQMGPIFRQKALHEPLNRKKKARADRRAKYGEKY
ncbi:hypothetical protein [Sphingorhabdus sp.]|uniref:hypothetical protein n=1 Tax=Sphingorhabdus sp. TaxID=1902408 RepID=UPI0037CA87AF